MKKIVLFCLFTFIGGTLAAQSPGMPVIVNPLKNLALTRGEHIPVGGDQKVPYKAGNYTVGAPMAITETQIGETRYDLQSNSSVQNRLFRFDDGTLAGTWTFGMIDPNFTTDRGTGYNYFDGSAWGAIPTVRIETIRTGWPSIFAWGTQGEAVISHDFGTPGGLILNTRAQKGTGAWTQSTLPTISGQLGPSWPRAVSAGTNNSMIHMISLTRPTGNSGTPYQGLDGAIVYTRSSDGGASWDIPYTVLPGMDSSANTGFGGDAYAWAEPRANTLAFIVGDSWCDIFLMKSTDNGATWTKTIIFQHPYPRFRESTTLVLDTPWVADGAVALTLDNNGKAHAFFGLMRVLNSDTTDGTTSYFPYTDGLAYWNEDMPAYTNLNFEQLWNDNKLVGYLQDVNGNDTVMEFDDIGLYFLSLTSMPNAVVDDDGNIFAFFTSVMENLSNGSQNYRHILARMSTDGGQTWGGFLDVTGGIIHNFHECVYPSLAAGSDLNLYMLFQSDDEPGLAVQGDTDPYGDNKIMFSEISKSMLGVGIDDIPARPGLEAFVTPNPLSDQGIILVSLEQTSDISLVISNMAGQVMKELSWGRLTKGTHQFPLDIRNLAGGIYTYTLKSAYARTTGKLVISR